MTTFTLVNAESDDGDPATVNMNAVGSTDNILVAIMNERSGTGHAPHAVTDANGTWTKILGEDQELLDSNARQSASLWWRQAVSADTSAAFNISADDGTAASKRISVYEVDPSAAYDWTLQVSSSDNSGTGSTSPQGSGSTSDPGGSDLFVFAFATWRNENLQNVSSIGFTNVDTGTTLFNGGSNGRSHGAEFSGTGQSSGAKSTDASWSVSGAGNECICGIAVFSDGAIGGVTIDATAGTITVTGPAVDIQAGALIQSTIGVMSLSGLDPLIETGITIAQEAGTITLSGLDPQIVQDVIIDAQAGILTLNGLDVEVLGGPQPADIDADTGAITLSGLNPALVGALIQRQRSSVHKGKGVGFVGVRKPFVDVGRDAVSEPSEG